MDYERVEGRKNVCREERVWVCGREDGTGSREHGAGSWPEESNALH